MSEKLQGYSNQPIRGEVNFNLKPYDATPKDPVALGQYLRRSSDYQSDAAAAEGHNTFNRSLIEKVLRRNEMTPVDMAHARALGGMAIESNIKAQKQKYEIGS